MDLTKILMESLGNGGLEQLGKQVGLDSSQTSSAMGALIPTMLGAMASNTKSESGASGLLGALDKDHDGSILDDLGGFLGGNMSDSRAANGAGILKHILGEKQGAVEGGIASKLGVDSGSIGKLGAMLAPMIMGYLGKQKRSAETSGFDAGGIGDILGQLAGGSQQNDGLDLGDIMDMVGGLSGNSGSSGGGLLGGLLKNVLKG